MPRSLGLLKSVQRSLLQSGPRSIASTTGVVSPKSVNAASTRNFTSAATGRPARRELPQWQRHLRSVSYAIIFGSVGYHGSAYVADRLIGPLPTPGTIEDEQVLKKLRSQLEKLEVARSLRANPDFVEWEAYGSFSPEEKAHRLTSGPLRGSRGLALQVSFFSFSPPLAACFTSSPLSACLLPFFALVWRKQKY